MERRGANDPHHYDSMSQRLLCVEESALGFLIIKVSGDERHAKVSVKEEDGIVFIFFLPPPSGEFDVLIPAKASSCSCCCC